MAAEHEKLRAQGRHTNSVAMRFLSFIHENEGEVNVMDENQGLAILRDLQQQSSQFHNTDEFMQYMKDADVALETVKDNV